MNLADAIEIGAKADHAAYRAERADGKLHAPEECPCIDRGCGEGHDFTADGPCSRCGGIPCETGTSGCHACRSNLREWGALTEAARETFRQQVRPIVEALRGQLNEARAEVEAARRAVNKAGADPRWAAIHYWLDESKDEFVKKLSDQNGLLELKLAVALERVKELEAEVVHVREAGGVHHDFSKQQLDELVRLRADLKTARTRVAQLEAALRPFANAGELFLPIGPSDDSGYVHEPDDAPIGNRQVWEGTPLTIGHLRAASRALDGEAGK